MTTIVPVNFSRTDFYRAYMLAAETEYSNRGMDNTPQSANMMIAEIMCRATMAALETVTRS